MTEERVWVEDRGWRLPSSYTRCRMRGCPHPPVADLARTAWSTQGREVRWWAYCADHLYGRRIRTVVECPVAPDSPAAQRGYVR